MKVLPADFEGQAIRRTYHDATDTWWFSVVDVVQALTEGNNARRYWSDLKRKLAQEAASAATVRENRTVEADRIGRQAAPDGLRHRHHVASGSAEHFQPKAEPIKLWLANVGYERTGDGRPALVSRTRTKDLAAVRPRRDVDPASHDWKIHIAPRHCRLARVPWHPARRCVS